MRCSKCSGEMIKHEFLDTDETGAIIPVIQWICENCDNAIFDIEGEEDTTMLMTKYALQKLGLRPVKGQQPTAYITEKHRTIALYDREQCVEIKARPRNMEQNAHSNG